jgi:branched-chain amino acid transport system substrate-binding protein
MLAAVEQVVAASGRAVRVVALDDGRVPARAAAAVESLLDVPGCLGVVGPKNSGSALAAVAVATAGGLPLVLPCATADELTTEGGVVFRLCAADRATATAAVALAAELDVGTLAVVADDTEYGRNLAAAINASAAAGALPTQPGVEGSDAAFLAMGEVEQAVLMKQLRAAGYRGQFLSAEGGPEAPIARLAGEAAEGAWLLYPGRPVDGRSVYAAEAGDAARVLLAAGGGGSAAIRANVVDGETGAIRFTATGERDGVSVSRYRVIGGAAQLVTG